MQTLHSHHREARFLLNTMVILMVVMCHVSRFAIATRRYTADSYYEFVGHLMEPVVRLNSRFSTYVRKLVALLLLSSIANAVPLEVLVVDRDGKPVPDVAVYLHTSGVAAGLAKPGTTAIMDQVDIKFAPNLLVVQSGTAIFFPNSDTVAHHVYSFSHPNHFKLPLYKGDTQPTVQFDNAGVVILGCNVHDNMLGYILVVDTPTFAKTDSSGTAHFDITPNTVNTASIWSPRIRDDAAQLSRSLEIETGASTYITFQMTKGLRPSNDQQSDALSWSDY